MKLGKELIKYKWGQRGKWLNQSIGISNFNNFVRVVADLSRVFIQMTYGYCFGKHIFNALHEIIEFRNTGWGWSIERISHGPI